MSAGLFAKEKYPPTLFERLADNTPYETRDKQALSLMTAEKLKDSVARDLESLLNCRMGYGAEEFERFPEVAQSIGSFGMSDFVGRSLANPADRNFICRSLERSIAIHERRLKAVHVALELDGGAVNRLRFTIHALLLVHPAAEPVFFDALLQPSTQQYSVSKVKQGSSSRNVQ